MASKIVVIGAVGGRIATVFEKLSKLHSKNSFSLAIFVGELFANPIGSSSEEDEIVSALVAGKINVPLPTYFTVGRRPLPEKIVRQLEASGGEICPNLYFLGKRSTIKTSEGIRIVALGGAVNSEITAGLSKDKYLPFHTEDDAKSLRGANTADILITSYWPSSIRTGSKVPFSDDIDEPPSEHCVADLCTALKPRYHFSTSDQIFYEREPFFHLPTDDQPETKSITRFISLASFDNPSKQKWLYAFSLDPNAAPPPTLPVGATASPIVQNPRKRQRLPNQEQSYSRFSQTDGHHRTSKRARQPPPTPAECFFCLSNPNLATHLITSIATDTYLTTAKGPLSKSTTFPALNCPAHILIIPLTHSPTLSSITDPLSRPATYIEMQRYRTALHSMLATHSKQALGAVTWEVSRAGGIHIHWQFLPVPADLIARGLVEAAFKVEAENAKYPTFKLKEIGDGVSETEDFFRVWIWKPGESGRNADGGEEGSPDDAATGGGDVPGREKSLVLPLSANFRFDLQFGRRVMAKLLGLEDRINWKDCAESEAEEVAGAETFKKAFKEFDFSLKE
ncbi:Cwf19-like, C-terminal domain-1 [Lasallia pustulata]|uniref:Cwf19-like, C-terminal domain-1 n=1 Tax=Lasallia pustulata TaxID=136370 RepID=A0A1W5CYQ8_9LECA|nr:Cwf19-like, C-terminal domain-1 [Lasallia pustulata]